MEAQLSPGRLLSDSRFQRRTCGASPELIDELRDAMDSKELLAELCNRLLTKMGDNSAVVVAPMFGKVVHCAVKGDAPSHGDSVVVWLLLDPTDIDSKQTTFASGSGCTWFEKLCKLKP
eukprot:CAMPEP_0185857510 /NCGR_PEP_ID=MMETSP1354-20130828/29543_1 /TAXON_ID=708628 /ORGANISM="Erythrolobus madagascarensis, Strain CCMP3276" /LENGTH=118 /DNA_ID=CAMNT_0028559781 /DNA_START=76 /DNA_END=432 /DNA_ORIENTATION=-